MPFPRAWVGLAGGLLAGLQSAMSVLADNAIESSLALADIWYHLRAEARSLAKAPYWARIKISPMPLSQANQILDVEPGESLDKLRVQRDKLLKQLSLSPFLQAKVNEAYNRLEKSKSGRYRPCRECRREGKIQILNKNI